MKFAIETVKQYRAIDGTIFDTREAVQTHEINRLCARLAEYEAGDFMLAVRGDDLADGVRADIVTLASLLRPPRAKRGSKAGESAAAPTPAPTTEEKSESAHSTGAGETESAAGSGLSDNGGAVETRGRHRKRSSPTEAPERAALS